jgi:hypothetical protein
MRENVVDKNNDEPRRVRQGHGGEQQTEDCEQRSNRGAHLGLDTAARAKEPAIGDGCTECPLDSGKKTHGHTKSN